MAVISEGAPTYGVELCRPDSTASLCLFQTAEKPAHLHLAFTADNRRQVDACGGRLRTKRRAWRKGDRRYKQNRAVHPLQPTPGGSGSGDRLPLDQAGTRAHTGGMRVAVLRLRLPIVIAAVLAIGSAVFAQQIMVGGRCVSRSFRHQQRLAQHAETPREIGEEGVGLGLGEDKKGQTQANDDDCKPTVAHGAKDIF